MQEPILGHMPGRHAGLKDPLRCCCSWLKTALLSSRISMSRRSISVRSLALRVRQGGTKVDHFELAGTVAEDANDRQTHELIRDLRFAQQF